MDFGNVPLYGIVLENLDSEPDGYIQSAWGGKHSLYLDEAKAFFPVKNGGALDLLKIDSIMNIIKLKMRDDAVPGNQKGNYKYHGGVLVVGAGDQGILYESYEASFGDKVDAAKLQAAVEKISPQSRL